MTKKIKSKEPLTPRRKFNFKEAFFALLVSAPQLCLSIFLLYCEAYVYATIAFLISSISFSIFLLEKKESGNLLLVLKSLTFQAVFSLYAATTSIDVRNQESIISVHAFAFTSDLKTVSFLRNSPYPTPENVSFSFDFPGPYSETNKAIKKICGDNLQQYFHHRILAQFLIFLFDQHRHNHYLTRLEYFSYGKMISGGDAKYLQYEPEGTQLKSFELLKTSKLKFPAEELYSALKADPMLENSKFPENTTIGIEALDERTSFITIENKFEKIKIRLQSNYFGCLKNDIILPTNIEILTVPHWPAQIKGSEKSAHYVAWANHFVLMVQRLDDTKGILSSLNFISTPICADIFKHALSLVQATNG